MAIRYAVLSVSTHMWLASKVVWRTGGGARAGGGARDGGDARDGGGARAIL